MCQYVQRKSTSKYFKIPLSLDISYNHFIIIRVDHVIAFDVKYCVK